MKAVVHNVPVLDKAHLDMVCAFADKVQDAQRESVTTRQLAVQDAKIKELELKMRLYTDDSIELSDLKKTLAAQTGVS